MHHHAWLRKRFYVEYQSSHMAFLFLLEPSMFSASFEVGFIHQFLLISNGLFSLLGGGGRFEIGLELDTPAQAGLSLLHSRAAAPECTAHLALVGIAFVSLLRLSPPPPHCVCLFLLRGWGFCLFCLLCF